MHFLSHALATTCLTMALAACGGSAMETTTPTPQSVRAAAAQLDTIVPRWLALTGVPGAAVAVVYRGQTVYARGFGVREVGESARVDADTVFQLASVSKSVGATVMATQMPGAVGAQGLPAIDWSTPVEPLLPGFTLDYADPQDNARLTLGDLYAHRSGLPGHAGDVLEDMGYTRAQILQRLSDVPVKPLADHDYDYTNFGLTAAAQAMATARGTDWATLSENALYQPLGMTSTSSRFADFTARSDRVWGHVQVGISYATYGAMPGQYAVQDPPRDPDAQSPAGGVSSSVNDLAQWMKLVLAGGVWNGRQLVSATALQQAMSPQSDGGKYGYGFNVGTDPHHHPSVSHSGAFNMGAGTAFTLWPEADLGIMVLTNAQPRGLAEAIGWRFGELAWGDPPLGGGTDPDYLLKAVQNLDAFHDLYKAQGRYAGQQPPAHPAPPSPSLAALTGSYTNAYFGTAQVALNAAGDGLDLIVGPAQVRYALQHWDGNTFVFEPRGEAFASTNSVSAVDFAPGQMQIELFSEDLAHGLFTRVAGSP